MHFGFIKHWRVVSISAFHEFFFLINYAQLILYKIECVFSDWFHLTFGQFWLNLSNFYKLQTMIGFEAKNIKPGLKDVRSTQTTVSHWWINPSTVEFWGCRMHIHQRRCQLFGNGCLRIDKHSIECKNNINWKIKSFIFNDSQTE